MTDEPVPTPPVRNEPCAYVRLWHPRRVQVNIPLLAINPATATEMLRAIDCLLDAGWLAALPGVEAGENVEEIGAVVRCEKENKDGTYTAILHLYSVGEQFKFPSLKTYLNNAESVAQFEAVSGLRLDSLPVYEGTNTIERGTNQKLDRYVVPLKKPTRAIWKENPKYPAGGYPEGFPLKERKPKRMFVRWLDAPPSSQPQAAPAANGQQPAALAPAAMSPVAVRKLEEANYDQLVQSMTWAERQPKPLSAQYVAIIKRRIGEMLVVYAKEAKTEDQAKQIRESADSWELSSSQLTAIEHALTGDSQPAAADGVPF